MLFKKFLGRWGGVIESGYEELIQNLSRLVERRLVNTQTLQSEIEKETFKDTLSIWIKDILQNELPERTKNLYVKDIPGIDETINRFADYLKHEKPPLDGITLNQILSETSFRYFVDRNTGKIFSDSAYYKNKAAEILNNFFAGHTFNDFFSTDIIKQIKTNINRIINEIDFSRHNTAFEQCFEQLIDAAGIDTAIKNLEYQIGAMSVSEFIEAARVQKLLHCTADFTESAAGKMLLRDIINELTTEAAKLNISAASILRPRFIENISLFSGRNTPELIDRLILFINNSKGEIDDIIADAAEQHFSRNGAVNSPVQAFVFGAVSKNGGFTSKIIEILEQNRNSAGGELSKELKKYLENTSIGSIVSRLKNENNGILNVENIINAINSKLRNTHLEDFEVFTAFMNVKIKNLIPRLDLSFIKTRLIPHIFNELKKSLYNKSNKRELHEKINDAIDSFMRRDINSILNVKKIIAAHNINEAAVKNLIFGQWHGGAGIASFAIGDAAVSSAGKIPWTYIEKSIKKYKINDAYAALQTESLYNKAANTIQSLVMDNLNTILGGNIFDIAKNELSVLSPQQVNKVLQGFMGTQLKPINTIGAILGGLAGAVTVFITYLLKIPEIFTWPLFAIYGVIFSIVGIGTNWIAIRMLFRPYKKMFGLNFPPFVGLTAYKQSEFASGIANLIQQNMLNKTALQRFYAEKKDGLLLRCKERLSAENYKFIDDFFSDDTRRAEIVDGVFNSLQKYIKKSSGELAEYIDNYIIKQLGASGGKNIAEHIRNALVQKILNGNLAEYAVKKIQSGAAGKTLDGIPFISEAILDLCRQYLQNTLDIEKITALLRRREMSFNNYIENHSLNDLAGKKTIDSFLIQLSEKFATGAEKAADGIAGFLAKQGLRGQQSLKNCFGGIAGALINHARCIKFIHKLAYNKKTVIVDKIMDGAGGTSFWGRVVKQAANALMRKDIEAITEIVISEKLLPFLNAHRGEVFGIINNTLEAPLGFDCEIFNKDKIETVLRRLSTSDVFLNSVKNFSAGFLSRAASAKLKETLSMINAGTISGFLEVFSPVSGAFIAEINDRLSGADSEMIFKNAFAPVLAAIFKDIPIDSVLCEIDAGPEVRKMLTRFFSDDAVVKNAEQILDTVLQKILSDKDFYNHALFRDDLSNFMTSCVSERYAEIRGRFAPFLNKLLRNANALIAPAAKNAIYEDYLLPALFNACGNQFPNLANSLSLYTVVEKEINMMSPKEIEELFYSFSGSYFKKIILYGWIGLFGGFLSYALSCLAARLFL
jgi:uncharacterized membrane protein YheB (UPF0754 family)